MPNKTDKQIKMKNIRLWAWILMVCLFTCCSNNEDNIVDDFPPLEEGMISDIEGDILIKPTGGQASEAQNGYGIEKPWDGDTNPSNHCHSLWGTGTKFPVTLE